MKIKEYMEKHKLTHRQFAELVGVSHSTIHHHLSGRRKYLSLPIVQKIVSKTFGKITLKDLMEESILIQPPAVKISQEQK